MSRVQAIPFLLTILQPSRPTCRADLDEKENPRLRVLSNRTTDAWTRGKVSL